MMIVGLRMTTRFKVAVLLRLPGVPGRATMVDGRVLRAYLLKARLGAVGFGLGNQLLLLA